MKNLIWVLVLFFLTGCGGGEFTDPVTPEADDSPMEQPSLPVPDTAPGQGNAPEPMPEPEPEPIPDPDPMPDPVPEPYPFCDDYELVTDDLDAEMREGEICFEGSVAGLPLTWIFPGLLTNEFVDSSCMGPVLIETFQKLCETFGGDYCQEERSQQQTIVGYTWLGGEWTSSFSSAFITEESRCRNELTAGGWVEWRYTSTGFPVW